MHKISCAFIKTDALIGIKQVGSEGYANAKIREAISFTGNSDYGNAAPLWQKESNGFQR